MPIPAREPPRGSNHSGQGKWRVALLLALVSVLAGCTAAGGPRPQSTAGAPAPGTARVYFGGRTDTSFGKTW